MTFDWAETQAIPPNRVVVAEFGCMRLWADCATSLTDVMDVVDEKSSQFYWLKDEGKSDTLPRDGKLTDLLKARMQK